MSKIEKKPLTLSTKNVIPIKQLKHRFYWMFVIVWIVVSGPGFFNFLYKLIDPIDITDIRSHRGVASLQYIRGITKVKSETLVVGDKYYECEMALPEITKGCKGIPSEYIKAEVLVEYISMPWEPSRVSNDFPIRITKITSGQSIVLIENTEKFVKERLSSDVASSIDGSIVILIIGFFIIKFIIYFGSKK